MKMLQKMNLVVILLVSAIQVPAWSVEPTKSSEPDSKTSSVEQELKFKVGDETGNEMKALKTEMLVMRSEKRALHQALKLSKKYQGTRLEPEILFRLGELYMRRARTERFLEVHKNSDQVLTFAPQLVSDASEIREIRNAVEIYEKLQAKFPHFRNIDVVIFNNAYAHLQLNEAKVSESLFNKLIKEYDNSPLVPDALLSLGEIKYSQRNFTVALEYFKKLRDYPEARVYPYGLYKAAWSYYNLQNAMLAMRQLEEVVKFGREATLRKNDAKLDLRKEALNDMTIFFGEVMVSGKAVDYFRDQSKELDASPYILHLVELYKRHDRLADVEIILKDFLAKMPDSPMIASAHDELIWNYEQMRNRPKVVAQLNLLYQQCQKTLSTPVKDKPQPARTECLDKIAETTKKLAGKWHVIWRKQNSSVELGDSTERAYQLYLQTADPKDKDIQTAQYAYAELLFQRNKFREASEQYAAVEQYHPVKKVSHDADYAAILSLEKATANKWNDVDEKRFLELSTIYLTNHPDGQFVLELKFKRAYIAYEKGRYDEAAPAFRDIGWNYPANEKVLKSQDLYLDILNIKKDYRNLREAAQLLMQKPGNEVARQAAVEKVYREAYFAEIQSMEEKGDLAGAVVAYKKFGTEIKDSELASKAWWNASQLEFKMGDAQAGANTCFQMHKLYPNSTNGKDCLMRAAQTFEAMGRLEWASRVLLNLALVDEPNQAKWQELAADFLALSGAKERARTMYLKMSEGQKGEKALLFLEKAQALAKESGDTQAYQAARTKILTLGIDPQASEVIVEQAEDKFNSGDLTGSFNLSKKIIAKESLPKNLLARARFIQARVLDDEYRKQSVKARVDRIARVLALKTEKLEKAQKAYQSTIHYGDTETTVKALRKLSDAYLHYALAVRTMQLPEDASAQDKQSFKGEIDSLAIPMEEKGIDSLNQALETAKKAQLRGGVVASIQNDLNKLNLKKPQTDSSPILVPGAYLPMFKVSASMEGKK